MYRLGILTVATCLFANILMAPTASAKATIEPLAVVTDENGGDVHQIFVIVDDVQGFMGLQMRALPQGLNTRPSFVKDFRTIQIASEAGIDLDEKTGMHALSLQGQIEKKSTDARIDVRFLKNAIFQSYDKCQVDFKLGADGHWHIHNIHTGNIVTQFHVVTGSVGIKTIVEICK